MEEEKLRKREVWLRYKRLIDGDESDLVKRVENIARLEQLLRTSITSSNDLEQKVEAFILGKYKPNTQLKQMRRKMKMKVEDISKMLGCTQSDYLRMEKGETALSPLAMEFVYENEVVKEEA